MRRVALAIAALAFAACAISLDGYSGGGADQPDAASDAPIVPADVSVSDAPSSIDGSTSGWIPCASRAASPSLLLCDDFDDPGEKPGAKWAAGSTGTVDGTATALSPPLGMRASIAALSPQNQYGFSK